MYYPRHLQPVLQKLSAQFPAVLLTGARQVGKSTLLQHIAPEYGYLTLDDPLLLDQAKNAADNCFIEPHAAADCGRSPIRPRAVPPGENGYRPAQAERPVSAVRFAGF